MIDMDPIQADDADLLDDAKAEHSQYGAGETGGGKPANGITGNPAAKGKERDQGDMAEVGVPPEEDPKMGV